MSPADHYVLSTHVGVETGDLSRWSLIEDGVDCSKLASCEHPGLLTNKVGGQGIRRPRWLTEGPPAILMRLRGHSGLRVNAPEQLEWPVRLNCYPIHLTPIALVLPRCHPQGGRPVDSDTRDRWVTQSGGPLPSMLS